MNKILVPTDFSIYATYAINAAVKIAQLTNGSITLYHTIVPSGEGNMVAQLKDTENGLNQLKNEISDRGIECAYIIENGEFPKSALSHLQNDSYDLVIMGSHGQSGFNEMFIGSNTQKLLRKSNTSVMVVKKPVESITFDSAVFITGLNIEDQQSLRQLLGMLDVLQVKKLHIMAIDTSSYFSQPTIIMQSALADFKKIAENYNVETHFYRDYSIESGVRHFSEEYNIDLIVVSNHKKHPIKRIFQGSNVEMIVGNSYSPVLALDHK